MHETFSPGAASLPQCSSINPNGETEPADNDHRWEYATRPDQTTGIGHIDLPGIRNRMYPLRLGVSKQSIRTRAVWTPLRIDS